MIMLDIINRELVYITYYFDIQFRQIFKYWVIGIIIGSIISVFAKNYIHSAVKKMYEKKCGFIGLICASALGIASPLCMYGTIPLASSFSKSGIKDDCLAAFMMSSVLLNPQLIIYSASLGSTALILRISVSFLCGVCAGCLINIFYKDGTFFSFKGFDEPKNRDVDPNLLIRLLKNIGRNVKATGPMFLLGILLSALFQRYVPGDTMTILFGDNKAWGVLMAATIGVPLYACGGGTIPLLRSWLAEGMSMGSAVAFMITGPSTKITNLGAVKIVLGIKRFIIYIIYVILFSLLSGLLINMILK